MTLADIPHGSAVFVDANTFVYHFISEPTYGGACTSFLERIERQEIEGVGLAAHPRRGVPPVDDDRSMLSSWVAVPGHRRAIATPSLKALTKRGLAPSLSSTRHKIGHLRGACPRFVRAS